MAAVSSPPLGCSTVVLATAEYESNSTAAKMAVYFILSFIQVS
jgi:hypothetical protein